MLPDRAHVAGEQRIASGGPILANPAARQIATPGAAPVSADPHELATWVAELRGRLARGEFADGGPIEVAGVALPGVELAVKVMLADLDHYDDLGLERRRDPLVVARRRLLLEDLRRLRAQIG